MVTPSNTIYPTHIYTLEYDGFADFPRYPINLISDLNAFAGIYYVHNAYPGNPSALPLGYAIHPLMIWLVGGGLWVLTTIPRGDPGMIHHIGSGFFGLVLVLPAVFGDGKSPHRILASAPLAWLGLISYGIFLWHEPLVNWFWANGIDTFGKGVTGFSALLLASLAIGILLGAFSYYVVEKPFHRR